MVHRVFRRAIRGREKSRTGTVVSVITEDGGSGLRASCSTCFVDELNAGTYRTWSSTRRASTPGNQHCSAWGRSCFGRQTATRITRELQICNQRSRVIPSLIYAK